MPRATPPKLPEGRTTVAGMLSKTPQGSWALQLSTPPSLKGMRLELDLGTCARCARWRAQLAPGAKVRARAGLAEGACLPAAGPPTRAVPLVSHCSVLHAEQVTLSGRHAPVAGYPAAFKVSSIVAVKAQGAAGFHAADVSKRFELVCRARSSSSSSLLRKWSGAVACWLAARGRPDHVHTCTRTCRA